MSLADQTVYADCPKCGALMGQPCEWAAWSFSQPHPEFHHERIDAATLRTEADAGVEPSKEAFEHAVEQWEDF